MARVTLRHIPATTLWVLLSLCSSLPARAAQELAISGTYLSADGQPLAGRLQLAPPLVIRGTVLDAQDQPIHRATVTAAQRVVVTAEDGTFQLETTPYPGSEQFTIAATAPGLSTESTRLRNSQPPTSVKLRLSELIELGGRVVNENGVGLSSAQVRVSLAVCGETATRHNTMDMRMMR